MIETLYKGKPLSSYTKEQLIKICEQLFGANMRLYRGKRVVISPPLPPKNLIPPDERLDLTEEDDGDADDDGDRERIRKRKHE